MDNMKILHIGNSNNLPLYSEIEKELIKKEIQAEQSMMLEYLESRGINLYNDNAKDKLTNSDNGLVNLDIPKNEEFRIDHDTLTSIAEEFSEFNLDIDTLIDQFKSLIIVSNNIVDINELVKSLNNNIRVVSIEEIPDKPKIINKGKTYHDNKKNLRFMNKRK